MFKDLPPRKDPKGGSPKTPLPMSLSKLHENETGGTDYVWTGNGTVWKIVGPAAITALIAMTIAWATALRERGMTREDVEALVRQSQLDQEKTTLSRNELRDYLRDYPFPWKFDKENIVSRLNGHDQQIGELRTKIDLAADVIKSQHKP